MAEHNLEDMVNAQNSHSDENKAKEKEKLQTPLEEIINGIGGIANFGLAAAAPLALGTVFPPLLRDAAIMAGAQVAADATTSIKRGEKYAPKDVLESSLLGTAIAGPLEAMFGAVNQIPLNSASDYFLKAAAWGGLAYPAFIGMYQTFAHLIREKTFRGLGNYLKENYWPTLKYAWTHLLPFSLINVFFVPPPLQIPVAAGLSYMFDLFGAPHKKDIPEERKRVSAQFYRTIPSLTAKSAKTVFYGVPQAFYNIGKGISDLTNGQSRPAASHAAAPAHG